MDAQKPSHVTGGRVARVAPLVGLAGQTAGEAVVASLRNRRHRDRDGQRDGVEFHTRNAQRYAERLGRSKGVLMKAGQIVSFVGIGAVVGARYLDVYQEAFARLQDDAPPMPFELASDMIARELGQPPAQLFAQFDPLPLAAASIGQVHAATLLDGRRVAVKVQYPGVEQAIKADLANTELLVTFFRLLSSTIPGGYQADWRGVAIEVAERIGEEIDYRIEATNQREFADAYRGHPFIRIPEVHPQLSTRRVLTMDLIEGLRYADALQADQVLRDRWAEVIYRFNAGSLLRCRMINADPHPGNYLFHRDGTVTFLDFGCVKRFTEQQTLDLARTVRATVARNPEGVAAGLIASGFFDPGDAPTTADLFNWYSALMTPVISPQPFTYTPEFAARVLRDELSPFSPHSRVLRKITGDARLTFLTRFDSGINAVLAALGATGPWNAIRGEYDPEGPPAAPATPMGEQDAAYRAAHR